MTLPVSTLGIIAVFWRFHVKFSSVQDGIYALGKAHMRSILSLRCFPTHVLAFPRWFFSVQDDMYALGKPHMRSTPSLRSFSDVAFETVTVLVWLTMAFLRTFKWDRLALPLNSTPFSSRRSMVWCPWLFLPEGSVSCSSTCLISREAIAVLWCYVVLQHSKCYDFTMLQSYNVAVLCYGVTALQCCDGILRPLQCYRVTILQCCDQILRLLQCYRVTILQCCDGIVRPLQCYRVTILQCCDEMLRRYNVTELQCCSVVILRNITTLQECYDFTLLQNYNLAVLWWKLRRYNVTELQCCSVSVLRWAFFAVSPIPSQASVLLMLYLRRACVHCCFDWIHFWRGLETEDKGGYRQHIGGRVDPMSLIATGKWDS